MKPSAALSAQSGVKGTASNARAVWTGRHPLPLLPFPPPCLRRPLTHTLVAKTHGDLHMYAFGHMTSHTEVCLPSAVEASR